MKHPGLISLSISAAAAVGAGQIANLRAEETPSLDAAIADMVRAADVFADALDPAQREKALFAWDVDERENWHYIPKDREGLLIKELDDEQRPLAFALLASGMSQRGFVKAAAIMSLEQILAEIEGAPERRDPAKYYVSIFGEPKTDGTWGWRVEGHHLSVNFTIAKGKFVAATPTFFGTNPAEVREGPRAGLRPLSREEDAARALAKALVEAGKTDVVFTKDAPREILTAAEREVGPLDEAGLPGAQMDDAHRAQLWQVIEEYVRWSRDAVAAESLAEIREQGLENVRFGWAGGLEPGDAHYYRVQGPTFLLEYANTQNDANHAHAVWRDFEGDFGRDILAEHYRKEHGE